MPKLPDPPHYATGDLWDYHRQGYWVVVTTNIGWKSNGENVMGRGVAAQAAKRFPDLPAWYGELCRKHMERVGICLYNPGRLILFPTKPLDKVNPHLSWRGGSCLRLIETSLIELVKVAADEHLKQIAMSWPGCGNGGLQIAQVKPLLNRYLGPRFTIVTYA